MQKELHVVDELRNAKDSLEEKASIIPLLMSENSILKNRLLKMDEVLKQRNELDIELSNLSVNAAEVPHLEAKIKNLNSLLENVPKIKAEKRDLEDKIRFLDVVKKENVHKLKKV